MKRTNLKHPLISLMLLLALAVQLAGCDPVIDVAADDLMDGIQAQNVKSRNSDCAFVNSQMALAVKLFQASAAESDEKNLLISPLSIQLALAMTANGADGTTKAEMEALLGDAIPLEALNEYLSTYVKNLPSAEKSKLQIANSIWFRDNENRLSVNPEFLQTNANYYGAQAYRSAFDDQTLADINNWVHTHTDGMIDGILDEIRDDAVMYLINALTFDAEWQTVYDKNAILDGTFTAASGEKQTVKMMHSEESQYFVTEDASGFFKNYKGGNYRFVAVLPNEDLSLENYVASLNAAELQRILQSDQTGLVLAAMPKFSYDFELSMNECLKELGMATAFDSSTADFSKMATSSKGNIFIGDVLHKTFISVDELGTKAGAVTKVEMNDEGYYEPALVITLNRPFLYMIVDTATNLPVFIGAVTDLG